MTSAPDPDRVREADAEYAARVHLCEAAATARRGGMSEMEIATLLRDFADEIEANSGE